MNDLRFPIEINRLIFGYLNHRELLAAMTVNRNWRQYIDANHTFDTVYMHSRTEFDRFMVMNRLYQGRGDHVRRLMIDIDRLSRTEVDALPFLIRNLEELYFYPKTSFPSLPLTDELQPHPWSDRIRKINEIASYMFTKSILANQICQNLVEISASGIGRNFAIDGNFIGLLEHAPNLISLKLSHFTLSLSNLDMLHDHAPHLSSLMLSDGRFLGGEKRVTQAAANMRELSFNSVIMSQPEILRNFQEYLVGKYPNLSTLEHDITVSGVEFTENVFRDLVQGIGAQLTYFKIGRTAYYTHAITELVGMGHTNLQKFSTCAITEAILNQQLDLLGNLAQVEPLRVLSLYNIANDSFINLLTRHPNTHELNLSARDTVGIDMETLLQVVGRHLQKLHLSYCIVDLERWTMGNMQQWGNLTHLVLESVSATDILLLGDFIDTSFPGLTHLKLDCILDHVQILHLDHLDLYLLEIRVALPVINQANREHQWIRVQMGAQVNFYTAKPLYKHRITEPFDRLTFPEVISANNAVEHGNIFMDIQCRTMRNFFLVNTFGA